MPDLFDGTEDAKTVRETDTTTSRDPAVSNVIEAAKRWKPAVLVLFGYSMAVLAPSYVGLGVILALFFLPAAVDGLRWMWSV